MCWSTFSRGLDAALLYLPYVMEVGNPRRPKMNVKDFVQSMLQSAVIGGVLLYGMVQVLDKRVDTMELQFANLNMQLNARIEKLEDKIERLNNEIWSLHSKIGK